MAFISFFSSSHPVIVLTPIPFEYKEETADHTRDVKIF